MNWHLARFRYRSLIFLAALACSACGDSEQTRVPVFKAKGKVYLRNQPTVGALVIFHPANPADTTSPRPVGRVGPDGSFTLTTFAQDDGAPAGMYDVSILWLTKKEGEDDDDDGQNTEDQLQGLYSNPRAAGIRRQIKEGDNDLEPIKLEG